MIARFLLIAFSVTAFVGVAHSSESGTPLRGGYCFTNNASVGPEIEWNCEHIGKVTLRQIYEKGFRVVGSYPVNMAHPLYPYLIIEELRR